MNQDLHLQAARHRAEALDAALKAAADAAPPRMLAPIAALAMGSDRAAALQAIEEASLAEEALDWLRVHRREDAELRAQLAPMAEKARIRRASQVHLDSNRVLARARYTKDGASLLFSATDVQTLFSESLRLEGLPLELDLGKRPRPLVSCAPPLPAGVAGEAEWLEIHLRRSVEGEADLLERLNRRLPQGLRLLDWDEQPVWASPVAELCEAAYWRWPSDDGTLAGPIAAFLGAEAFFLDKAGKVEGKKQDKRLDLRPVVLSMAWEGGALTFTTSLRAGPALNPLKLLGAILGRSPESILGLCRTGFGMREDARLLKGDHYTAKLKNMYEDAVLLGAASNITLVDDDEDEPLSLG